MEVSAIRRKATVNFNYEKSKTKAEHGGNAWTSYSDLFLVLSVVFLLLYVVSSLRTGTSAIVTMQQFKITEKENASLREQIKAYEVLKDDYLRKGASQSEVAMYKGLMQRLDLLGGQTHEEREKLETQSRELSEKERALNQYQAMMKNIIQANIVAQGRLHERGTLIEEKEKDISGLNQALSEKSKELTEKQNEIAQNETTIENTREKLARSIKEINYAYRSKKKSQEAMKAEIARLKSESDSRISALEKTNARKAAELKSAQDSVAAKNRELEHAIAEIQERESKYSAAVANAAKDREEKLAKLRSQQVQFEHELAAAKMSAEEKIKKQKAYLARLETERAATDARLKNAQRDLDNTRENLRGMEGNYQRSIASLSKSNDALKHDLHESLDKKKQRRKLAERIGARLKQAGIDGSVDPESGEVTVQFMEEYFDYGKAELKPQMREKLAKLFPAYAAALYEKQDAEKIVNVDIIGFASPTFRGRVVNPNSLSEKDRAAVNFNMDLSYQRAKSIFSYVFNPSIMNYAHQQDLLRLVRVTGRSYLTEIRTTASAPGVAPCQLSDCQKSQKVIIKFNLKDE